MEKVKRGAIVAAESLMFVLFIIGWVVLWGWLGVCLVHVVMKFW